MCSSVELILGDAQQIPLDLQARRRKPMPLLGQPLELPAQQLPRREVKRHAAVEIFVAQHPADAGRPRQHAEGRGIGNDGEIGRAGHLVEAHAAAARERREGAGIGGIERGGRDVDVVAARRARRGTPAPSPPWRARRRADRPRRARTSCSLSFSTWRLSSSACRRCSSVQRPCRSMNPRGFVTCTIPCARSRAAGM